MPLPSTAAPCVRKRRRLGCGREVSGFRWLGMRRSDRFAGWHLAALLIRITMQNEPEAGLAMHHG
ncbi:hypothetical protein CFB84_16915 [Burkholderia aenigmatica]|uniref:Uncharacterized protein n=1 Tax=Burkholderia aenigmatica TaxID=2015348 RepID=A0A228IW65_9BURK|nr:hypothetical protein CFB84_16915 [Burkholderia aenigmatica]